MCDGVDKATIRTKVDEILARYQIDNFQLALDLSDELSSYFNPVHARQGAEASLEQGMASPLARFTDYSERYWPYLRILSDPWKFVPPTRQEKAGANSYPGWIKALNSLVIACGEFGPDLLNELYADHQQQERTGKAFNVFGPQSLINAAAGKAAEKRRNGQSGQQQSMFKEEIRIIDGHEFKVAVSF
jgi:hypothetical protein